MTELRKQARFVKFLESMEDPDKEAIDAARAELRAYLPSAWDVIEKKLRSKRGQDNPDIGANVGGRMNACESALRRPADYQRFAGRG